MFFLTIQIKKNKPWLLANQSVKLKVKLYCRVRYIERRCICIQLTEKQLDGQIIGSGGFTHNAAAHIRISGQVIRSGQRKVYISGRYSVLTCDILIPEPPLLFFICNGIGSLTPQKKILFPGQIKFRCRGQIKVEWVKVTLRHLHWKDSTDSVIVAIGQTL